MSRIVSFVILLVIAIAVGIVCFQVMSGFILPLFMAALTVVIFRPVYLWLKDKCNGRASLAAILTTLLVMLIVLVPLGWGLSLGIAEGFQLLNADDGPGLDDFFQAIRTRAGLVMPLSGPIVADGKQQGQTADIRNPLDAVREALDRFPTEDRWEEIQRKDRLEDDLEKHLERMVEDLTTVTEALDASFAREFGGQLADPSSNESSSLDREDSTRLKVVAEAFDQFKQRVEEVEAAVKSKKIVLYKYMDIESQVLQEKVLQADLTYQMFRRELLGGIPRCWAVELVNPNETQMRQWKSKAAEWLRRSILPITGQTAAFVGNVVGWGFGLAIMLISTYYFLVDGPGMFKTIMQLSPLDDRYELALLAEFDKVSRAVVLATLLSAVAQGLLAGIAFFIAGFDSLFLLIILTTILALIPFVGAAAVWIPAAVWLALVAETPDGEGTRVVAGTVLAIYGFTVISMADNIIKPWVLHGQSKLHPLLALLSVLGGVSALGPIGILVGPMVVAFLQALLSMLQKELQHLDSPLHPESPMAPTLTAADQTVVVTRDDTKGHKIRSASKETKRSTKGSDKGPKDSGK